MLKWDRAKYIINQILLGEYHLDCRRPMEFLDKDIDLLTNYNPHTNQNEDEKWAALDILMARKRDLELGLKKN